MQLCLTPLPSQYYDTSHKGIGAGTERWTDEQTSAHGGVTTLGRFQLHPRLFRGCPQTRFDKDTRNSSIFRFLRTCAGPETEVNRLVITSNETHRTATGRPHLVVHNSFGHERDTHNTWTVQPPDIGNRHSQYTSRLECRDAVDVVSRPYQGELTDQGVC